MLLRTLLLNFIMFLFCDSLFGRLRALVYISLLIKVRHQNQNCVFNTIVKYIYCTRNFTSVIFYQNVFWIIELLVIRTWIIIPQTTSTMIINLRGYFVRFQNRLTDTTLPEPTFPYVRCGTTCWHEIIRIPSTVFGTPFFFGMKSLQKRYHNKHIITWSVAWHCQIFGISPPQLRYFWVNPICSETYDAASTPQHYRIKKQQLIVYSRLPRHNLSLFFLRHSPHSNTRAKRSATATGWMMCAAHSMPYASSLRAFSSYWLSLFYSFRRILWSRIKLEASSDSNRSLCNSAQNSHKHTVQVIA